MIPITVQQAVSVKRGAGFDPNRYIANLMSTEHSKTVLFNTVGCRLNQYETEKMAASLAPYGFFRVHRNEAADLVIINTCTVTHKADRDCRYLVRRAKRDNPQARVVLVGCYVETDREGIAALDGVDFVVGNSDKNRIVELLSERFPEIFDCFDPGADSNLVNFYERNRAWVKISDGCNQTCSYCLVTIVRGDLVCRKISEIIAEINHLTESGYNEVVLTAVNMGKFEDHSASPPVASLAELCRRIIDQTSLCRLRLSSIEPQTITDELIELYASAGSRICRHWHVPLQSGSDRILKLMRRPYDREFFRSKCLALKSARPGTVIGADIIAGFPGETEEDFAASLEIVESGCLDYLHSFSYSDRAGTIAAGFQEKVTSKLIRSRATRLGECSDQLLNNAFKSQVGETLDVISEFKRNSDGYHRGVSDNYLRVRLPSDLDSGRQIVRVKIDSVESDCISGTIC